MPDEISHISSRIEAKHHEVKDQIHNYPHRIDHLERKQERISIIKDQFELL